MDEQTQKEFTEKLRLLDYEKLNELTRSLYGNWQMAERTYHRLYSDSIGYSTKGRATKLACILDLKKRYEIAKEMLGEIKPQQQQQSEPAKKKKVIVIPEGVTHYKE